MWLPDFEYHRVASVSQAADLLAAHGSDARIIAGGTDLLLQMMQGRVWDKPCPRHLISMRSVTDLKHLGSKNGFIHIGANVTHRDAEVAPLVKDKLGALYDAIINLGSVQIRNVASIAGNICNAAPCADTAAPLLVLGARLTAVNSKGRRSIELKDFFRGPGQTLLEADEVVEDIILPQPPDFSASSYLSITRRKAMDITMIGVAVNLCCGPDKSRIKEAKIALNSAAKTPIRAYAAESLLKGVKVDEKVFAEAGVLAAVKASPRTSFRGTEEYRREMIKVLVARSLHQAFMRIS